MAKQGENEPEFYTDLDTARRTATRSCCTVPTLMLLLLVSLIVGLVVLL